MHLGVKKRKLASRMKLWRSYQAGKKIESRVENDSVKVWELDSYNSDVYIDSFVLVAQPLYRSYPFSSSPFCQTSFKKNRATEKLSLRLERIAKHKGFF